MQQLLLPLIPHGTTIINGQLSVDNRHDEWFYFLGGLPIYSHRADNKKLFRLHTSQLINSGACRAIDIIRTFGVSKSNVMRSLRQLREKGADSFFEPRVSRQGGTVLTPEVLQQAQQHLDQGMTAKETANELDIKSDTLRKALSDGRLKKI
jgi:transposase-like protein